METHRSQCAKERNDSFTSTYKGSRQQQVKTRLMSGAAKHSRAKEADAGTRLLGEAAQVAQIVSEGEEGLLYLHLQYEGIAGSSRENRLMGRVMKILHNGVGS